MFAVAELCVVIKKARRSLAIIFCWQKQKIGNVFHSVCCWRPLLKRTSPSTPVSEPSHEGAHLASVNWSSLHLWHFFLCGTDGLVHLCSCLALCHVLGMVQMSLPAGASGWSHSWKDNRSVHWLGSMNSVSKTPMVIFHADTMPEMLALVRFSYSVSGETVTSIQPRLGRPRGN